MLEVRRLNAFYGQAQALFDVNFQVPLGSLVLVQGLSLIHISEPTIH